MTTTARYALDPFPPPQSNPDAVFEARFDEFRGILTAARNGMPYSKARFRELTKLLMADLRVLQHAKPQ